MKATEGYLLNLLSNNDVTFYIPPYQRNYEWDKEQCEVFFEDILRVTENNILGEYTEHFFGSIVFVRNEGSFGEPEQLILTDGQQRITTTMLFLIALRDVVTDEKAKKFIDDKYLKNPNAPNNVEHKVKLKQVEADWNTYLKIILNKYITKNERESIVYKNYSFFKEKLNKIKVKNDFDVLEVIQKGLDKLSVVTIELEPDKNNWENPQEVFESMNSLGKPLSLADLVRNYLLLGLDIETQVKYYKEYWLHIDKVLGSDISNYIRDYMQYVKGVNFKKPTPSNYKDLYSTFKTIFIDVDTEKLFRDLNEFVDYYSYLILEESTGNKVVDNLIKDFNVIGVTTAYPFLLGLIIEWKKGNIKDSELEGIFKAIKVFLIRRRILGVNRSENIIFPRMVRIIPELVNTDNKVDFMFTALSSHDYNFRLPNDYEVYNALNTMNFYNNSLSTFILSLVEEHLSGVRPDMKDKNVKIENIMPRTLNDHWKMYLGENYETIHHDFVNNIGNVTLIKSKNNLGARTFQKKKELFLRGFKISKENITNKYKWNKDNMIKRREWIVDLLLKEIIPIPEQYKFKNNYSGKKRNLLSFFELQLINEEIEFIHDTSIKAKVISDKEVLFEGEKWLLSPLTHEIEKRRNNLVPSGQYQGAQYWMYDGMKLAEIM